MRRRSGGGRAAEQAHEADEVRDGKQRGPRSLCAVFGGHLTSWRRGASSGQRKFDASTASRTKAGQRRLEGCGSPRRGS